MILCVTPNPAIDRTARVDRVQLDAILRPTEVVALPGGKGVNIARAVTRLGALAATSGIAGGHAGRWLVESLAREGLNPRFVDDAQETRTTYVAVDDRGHAISVYEPSAPVANESFDALLELLSRELLPACSSVAFAGSLPRGLEPGRFSAFVEAARRAARRSLVDTSGPALAAAVVAGPDIVKVSLDEAEAAGFGAHERLGPATRVRAAVDDLMSRGARAAMVTDGPRPAVAGDGRSMWSIAPPSIRALSATGSGDATNAGILVSLEEGRSFEEAVVRGVAAGAANALGLGAGRLDPAEFERLVPNVRLELQR